jgi:glyoxylase-like metal-dependent hydrolase (beta-lactamase superfamily II)
MALPSLPSTPDVYPVLRNLSASSGITPLHGPQGASAGELRLYIFDCGTIIFNYPELYNLTRQEVNNTNFSVSCYLVVHPRGTLLFDTGLPDRWIGRSLPNTTLGGKPPFPSEAYFGIVTKTLRNQLAEIGFTPDKITYVAVSHSHSDHTGNVGDYAGSTWLTQKAEYDVMFGPAVRPETINPDYRALKESKTNTFEGDHDVFGDGKVVLKYTPGHTPGHQSLYIKLAKTGGIVLSGDLYRYPEERTLGRMLDREKASAMPASRAALESFMQQVKAELWIGHDITAFANQRKSPEYYE